MHSPDGMLALGWRGLGPTLLRVRSRRVSGLRARLCGPEVGRPREPRGDAEPDRLLLTRGLVGHGHVGRVGE